MYLSERMTMQECCKQIVHTWVNKRTATRIALSALPFASGNVPFSIQQFPCNMNVTVLALGNQSIFTSY